MKKKSVQQTRVWRFQEIRKTGSGKCFRYMNPLLCPDHRMEGALTYLLHFKARIFPELKPYKMSVADFQEAIYNGAGISLKKSSREKLIAKNAGLLEDLKQEILKTGQTVEQEYFL